MHQHFIKNKKIILFYKDGRQKIARYRVSDKGILYFYDHDPIPLKRLRAVSYYKGK